jgi:FKBP-type peptidyl-prolyl cis-trans isomerase FklB
MKSKILFCFFLTGLLVMPARSQNTGVLTSELDSVSYGLGILLGSSIEKAGIKDFSEKLFMQGIKDVTSGQQLILSTEQANASINAYLARLNEMKAVVNLLEGKKFLDENGKKSGVVTLPSGLQYKVIKEGDGVSPADTSVVTVHYTGTLINGEVFDSSVERGEPAQFPVNGVIAGWTEALQLMKPGANYILYIPPQLGYGEYGTRGIEPNSVLIFDVQLISVE